MISWTPKKIVFFGAHTDDEMVCAGTLHRLVREGSEVHIVTFSPAATEEDRRGERSSEIVWPEWHKALDLIGVQHRTFCQMEPSCCLANRGQEICQIVYDYCEGHRPDVVFTLSPDDENTAHSVVGRECERVMRGRVPTTIRCQFPWNFSLGRPNLFVELQPEDIECKRQVIAAYQSQAFRYHYGDMLLHYATADGLSVKRPAVEKFEIVRAVL